MKKKVVVKKKKKSSKALRNIVVFAFLFLLTGAIVKALPLQIAYQCANSISCEKSTKLMVENGAEGIYNNQKIIPPKIDPNSDTSASVLGTETTASEKHIYVDLSTQTLSAFDGKTLFMKTKISSGKTNPTPTGEFTIWVKLLSTRMTGGSGSTYYDLPNVPYVMFFYNKDVDKSLGYSFHGAYWHDNFGHPMSHGCINMRDTDAQKLYNWATPLIDGNTTYADDKNPGTKVSIYGTPPQ